MTSRQRGGLLTVAAAWILALWAPDLLKQWAQQQFGGVVQAVLWSLVGIATVVWIIGSRRTLIRAARRFFRSRKARRAVPQPLLRRLADQAEEQLAALDTRTGGLAADWFHENSDSLKAALLDEPLGPNHAAEIVDDLAKIGDALDAWYIRERRGQDLLEVALRSKDIANHTTRPDLQHLAGLRAAAAHRIEGELERAKEELDTWDQDQVRRTNIAAALDARRESELALYWLAKVSPDVEAPTAHDANANARTHLDRAATRTPKTDVAGVLALQIDRAVLALLKNDPQMARRHIGLAIGQAAQAQNLGAHAHAIDLRAVAAFQEGYGAEAIRSWRDAHAMFADVHDTEGRARCLANMTAAARANTEAHREIGGEPAIAQALLDSAQLRGRSIDADPVPEPSVPEGREDRLLARLWAWLRGRGRS